MKELLVRGPYWVQFMVDAPSRGGCRGPLWVHRSCLPGSTWTVQAYHVVCEMSKVGVQIEALVYKVAYMNGKHSILR